MTNIAPTCRKQKAEFSKARKKDDYELLCSSQPQTQWHSKKQVSCETNSDINNLNGCAANKQIDKMLGYHIYDQPIRSKTQQLIQENVLPEVNNRVVMHS